MSPWRARCRLMKLRCAKSSARMCKSSLEKSASGTCGITHSSMPLPISSKILFREPGSIHDETATRCMDNPVTTSKQKFQDSKEQQSPACPPEPRLRRVRRRWLSSARITIQSSVRPAQTITAPAWLQNLRCAGGVPKKQSERRLTQKPYKTLRFVAFVNEEPPYFLSGEMGSLVYARRCKERGDKISAMISLETIGYFSDAPHSQMYPSPGLGLFYP